MATVTTGTVGGACPAPTQIDCIEVTKVYDSCYQMQNFNNVCAHVPNVDNCRTIAMTTGTVATCAVTSSTCTLVSSTATGVDDQYTVTFAVALVETITLTSPAGMTCTIDVPINFVTSTNLCIPAGATPSCTVATSCGPCAIIPPATMDATARGDCPTVCCAVNVCLLLQSTAQVQLLVPSYGFCAPPVCQVAGLLPCPPYPANTCTTSTTTGSSWGTSTGTSTPTTSPIF